MSVSTRMVLCVDDDPDDREIVCHTIAKIDDTLQVVPAEDGLEALSILKNAKEKAILPCLVILDINMPRLDGKQTLVEIKKDDQLAKVPVVIFSTSGNEEDKNFCDRYGVELVTKPSTMQSMQEEVKRLLKPCVTA